jgi:hypothetical protein
MGQNDATGGTPKASRVVRVKGRLEPGQAKQHTRAHVIAVRGRLRPGEARARVAHAIAQARAQTRKGEG